jgi:hypothetical protein
MMRIQIKIRTLWRKIMINLKLSFTCIIRNYHPFFISSKRYVYMWNLESYAATDFIKRSKVFALFGPLSFFWDPQIIFIFTKRIWSDRVLTALIIYHVRVDERIIWFGKNIHILLFIFSINAALYIFMNWCRSHDGSRIIFDDFREAYWWLRMNTPEDAKVQGH